MAAAGNAAGKNAQLASSAMKAAAKEVTREADDPALSNAGAGGFKTLLWALIVLNVAALGGYAWLRFSRNRERESLIERAQGQLRRLKTDLVNLDDTVRRIQRDSVQQVDDPGTLLVTVAAKAGIADTLITNKPITVKFGKTTYDETTVQFTFRNRAAYGFAAILRFFTDVEKANPSIQIKELDLGERKPTATDPNFWEIKKGIIRVLKPQRSTG